MRRRRNGNGKADRRGRLPRTAVYMTEMCIILAAVFFCICGLTGMRSVKARSGGILLAAAEESERPEAAEIGAMREQEAAQENPVEFTAWSETQETVTSLDGCRRMQTAVIRLCGSSEYLIPYGKILQDWDGEGCLIGEETAETLFGSRKAEGLSVSCDGREYVVRGVLSSPAKLLVIADDAEDTSYEYIALGYRGDNKRGTAEGFLARYNLSMQLMERTGFTGTFSVAELLPGKWSDFDGWKRNFASWREAKRRQKGIAPSVLEVEAGGRRNAAAGMLAVGILLFAAGALCAGHTRQSL